MEPGVSIKLNTLPPISCTRSTRATISFVLPETEDSTTTDFSVKRLFPVVKNSAAFSANTGKRDLPRMCTSACRQLAQVPPMPMNQMPSKPSAQIWSTIPSIFGRSASAPFTLAKASPSSKPRRQGHRSSAATMAVNLSSIFLTSFLLGSVLSFVFRQFQAPK